MLPSLSGDWLTPEVRNLVARRGKDSPYLFYCLDPEYKPQQYWSTLFSIRFKLSTFPDGLYSGVRVVDTAAYDNRYVSFSTAESVVPQPTIVGLDGEQSVEVQAHAEPSFRRRMRKVLPFGG